MAKDKTDSHKRIVDAARKEFLKYGYNDASLRRIADDAGIRVSGLYKHFPNKEEMFASLVEPVIEGFNELYRRLEGEYYDGIDDDEKLKADDGAYREMEYIYDHLEEFKLIVLCAKGSKYEDFIHKVASIEEEATIRYMKALKKNGCPVKRVDPTELHLLTSAYVEAYFQPVLHGLDRKKALHFAKTLQEFYEPAWKALFGI